VVIGDVEIGEESSVWPMTVVRGDVHYIGWEAHQYSGRLRAARDERPVSLVLGDQVTVGIGDAARCTIHSHVLIGMGCII